MAKPRFFPLDADLWQVPGPLKLDWPTRKLAIYLREASSHNADPACYRTRKRIRQDLGMTAHRLRKSLETLKRWPDEDTPFLRHVGNDDLFILRPVPNRWVKAYRAIWESSLPDSHKDVLLFVWSQFETSVPVGNSGSAGRKNLYRCNLYGKKQPSIVRCCYVPKRGKNRDKRVSGIVEQLRRGELLVVYREATSRSPMLVEEPHERIMSRRQRCNAAKGKRDRSSSSEDSTPEETAGTAPGGSDTVGNQKERRPRDGRWKVESGGFLEGSAPAAGRARKRALVSSGRARNMFLEGTLEESEESFSSEKSFEKPQSEASSEACGGWGEERREQGGPSVDEAGKDSKGNTCLSEGFDSEGGKAEGGVSLKEVWIGREIAGPDDAVAPHIKNERHQAIIAAVESSTVALKPSRRKASSLAKALSQFLDRLPEDVCSTDIGNALDDPTFHGLREMSWGLLLSATFRERFQQKILSGYRERKQYEREKVERLRRIQQSFRSSNFEDRRRAAFRFQASYYPELSDEVARYIGEESDWRALYPFLLRIGESTEKFPHEDYSNVIRVCRKRLHNEEDSVIRGGLGSLLEGLGCETS